MKSAFLKNLKKGRNHRVWPVAASYIGSIENFKVGNFPRENQYWTPYWKVLMHGQEDKGKQIFISTLLHFVASLKGENL